MRRIAWFGVLFLLVSACARTQEPEVVQSPIPSAAAPGPQLPTIEDRPVAVEGQADRTYRLVTPPDLTGPSPVVMLLSDAGGTPDSLTEATQFNREAATSGFLVAYPFSIGSGSTWNAGFCCGPAPSEEIDDLGFLGLVLDDLAVDPAVDADRIYVAGVSNGAIMAHVLACEMPQRLAGVASVAGAMIMEDCQPSQPVSMLAINGTADPLVPYDGGELADLTSATKPIAPLPDIMSEWAQRDDCDPDPATTTEGPVTDMVWSGCADQTSVRLISIEGGGHTWFAPGFGPENGAVDATAVIAEFFSLR